MNPIEKNAIKILKELVEHNFDSNSGMSATGDKIKKLTKLNEAEINDSVDYLDDLDAITVLNALGTAPYNFFYVHVTPKGKYFYHELFKEKKGKSASAAKTLPVNHGKTLPKSPHETADINDYENEFEISLPKRPLNPVGSPYGFTDEDWEMVSFKKSNMNKLYVIFGLQYSSNYYNTNELVSNVKNRFESSVEQYNGNFKDEQIELVFKKLQAGYGEHVFNGIARDIISSDLAIFEISDKNPNVMIEMGVALTWGIRVIPLWTDRKLHSEKDLTLKDVPSDISGQTWIKYAKSGEIILDDEFQDKLNITVERAIKKKKKFNSNQK